MSTLSWIPKRRGKIYCSPACGGGCTYAEYLSAKTKAAKLVKRLGRGWKPRVWENLGWHYQAVKGDVLSVSELRRDCYHAYFVCGVFDGRTPQLAVSRALAHARTKIADLQEIVRRAES